ncbi:MULTISPECIES: DUF3617 family protein [unclassified Duganella]|uniref:DUF3617 domain-containing protein n=1 Tax=unclassified Duganella TaxID=2636909 RepID=UPI001314ACFA|nr:MULTISPECIES: DUF3617 family protein [unclassified Duganella]
MFTNKCMLCAALLIAHPAYAQQAPRPGVWEQWVTPKPVYAGANSDVVRMLDESNRQTKAKLAAMPEERRAAIEKEMATAGVDLRLSKPDGVMSAQQCMTAKEAARLAAAQLEQKANCQRTVTQQGDGVTVVVMTCKDGDPAHISTSTFTYYGEKAYSIDAPMATISARWLRDDCSGIQ